MGSEKPEVDALTAFYEEQKESAKLVFEHIKMLWDDQVELAETLREKRKVTISLLAILLGLGLFRVQLLDRPDSVLVVTGGYLFIVRWSFVAAMGVFICGTYFLFTERPKLRLPALWMASITIRYLIYLYKVARIENSEERLKIMLPSPPRPKWPSGRCIQSLLDDSESLNDWFSEDPTSVIWKRADRLREAQKLLRIANDRVKKRIMYSMALVFLGFLLVFSGLIAYVLGIRGAP